MCVCQRFGAVGIPGNDGAQHLLVFVGQETLSLGLGQILELDVQNAPALVEERAVLPSQVGVLSRFCDFQMEIPVGRRHFEMVVSFDCCFEGLGGP